MPVETTESSQITEGAETPVPRSRRSVLAAALGGVAASIAAFAGRPQPARAAAGSSLIIGSTANDAGTSNTILSTSSSVVAFELIQNGPGTALMGYVTPGTGGTRGVYGRSDSPNGHGVQARNGGTTGTGAAIRAFGGTNTGVDASVDSGNRSAVRGAAAGGVGVYGVSTSFHGVEGRSEGGQPGVYGSSDGQGVYGGGGSAGVYGVSASGSGVEGFSNGDSGHGVVGSIGTNSGTAAGVYGASAGTSSFAGYFEGHVGVVGTLSKGGGTFRIDHPLDPANRILQHSFVESPDMLNIYNGVVTADAKGEATVTLPAWFMALNRDFRYGLTPIGEFAPLYVKAKVADGHFTLGGAKPGQEVSWQLTGIRQDAWANANRIQVELDKPAAQQGQYLHPVEHGQPRSKGVDYPMQQRLEAAREQAQP
jgi:trimeric autotransporter adhesin